MCIRLLKRISTSLCLPMIIEIQIIPFQNGHKTSGVEIALPVKVHEEPLVLPQRSGEIWWPPTFGGVMAYEYSSDVSTSIVVFASTVRTLNSSARIIIDVLSTSEINAPIGCQRVVVHVDG